MVKKFLFPLNVHIDSRWRLLHLYLTSLFSWCSVVLFKSLIKLKSKQFQFKDNSNSIRRIFESYIITYKKKIKSLILFYIFTNFIIFLPHFIHIFITYGRKETMDRWRKKKKRIILFGKTLFIYIQKSQVKSIIYTIDARYVSSQLRWRRHFFAFYVCESSVRASARSCRKLLNSAHYFHLYR